MALEDKNIINHPDLQTLPVISRLSTIIRFVLRKWWLFAVIGIFAGILGVWYASSKKPEYKSHLTFALDDGDNTSVGSFLNLASQFGLNIGSSGKSIFAGDNILEIMKSRRMIESVLLSIDTFNNKPYTLIEYYLNKSAKRKQNSKIKDIHFPVNQARSTFSYQQDSLLYKIYQEFSNKNIVAQRPDRKLSIYEVSVSSMDEKFTKDFTDRIVAATDNFYTEIRTKKAKETLDVLEERVAAMKVNLNSSIMGRATVQDVNINPAFSEAQVPVQKQQTNIQVYGAAYGELFKNLELARFQYLNQIPLMQVIDRADYPMEKIKSGKLKMAILFSLFAGSIALFIMGMIDIFSNKN
jgi:uncharacterized protein involved in exopolysaccharide biosynthesis